MFIFLKTLPLQNILYLALGVCRRQQDWGQRRKTKTEIERRWRPGERLGPADLVPLSRWSQPRIHTAITDITHSKFQLRTIKYKSPSSHSSYCYSKSSQVILTCAGLWTLASWLDKLRRNVRHLSACDLALSAPAPTNVSRSSSAIREDTVTGMTATQITYSQLSIHVRGPPLVLWEHLARITVVCSDSSRKWLEVWLFGNQKEILRKEIFAWR